MSDTYETRIPRYLNAQAQLLWWELDEVAVITAALGMGIMYEMLLLSVPLALIAAKAMSRVKADHGHGWLLHAAWWQGLPLTSLTIPSSQRELWG
jgi:type IV conjugative transfer system protein TraL